MKRGLLAGWIEGMPSRYRALARQQWPLALALGLFLLLQLGALGFGPSAQMGVGLSAVLVVTAVVAPLRPFRAAMVTSLLLVGFAVLMTAVGGHSTLQYSLAGLCGAMAVLAYSVRYLEKAQARLSVVTLIVSLEMSMAPELVRHASDLGDLVRGFLALQLFAGLMVVPSLITGLYFRGADRERDQRTGRKVLAAQQAERMALARELHDVVAHHVTGIVVQSQAARIVAANNPEAVAKALELIEHSGTEALTAMRRLVGTMREGTAPGDSAATQATMDLDSDLRALVDRAGRSGIPARLDAVPGGDVPPEVGRSVLRLVQEALTNSGKHARNITLALVAVYRTESGLRILVTDDGDGGVQEPVGGSGGYGLIGMRERVDLLGGEFSAGPGPHHGWRVEVLLPMQDVEAE
ncbi:MULTISPECIES: sensor histidine kinase [Actinoalloteichus]|uniref:histidine kinase n=1 Tax=Actinoalloteichus fjordicus TaxID=1612552 RepID=A0AAC9LJD5_9PSEU|nr:MULTISPECIES: histidine kinase [Actinoalloteichus]APU17895.1 signal transduction histidine kinase [Actinoalloteichus fjordicus]APU23973.1 signal transduction histidine kinase [Actinoalloteichus sp. GBA129-24]